ncbi:NrfD/PsrC family molybdoenzyme membrane anchor subunit [Desulfitibacter alkalitolerans]|uniref:NrfD/PsrC family molybdoenzyme membrane anchor subunit n=1 Tax=Desulfitibacter alkalitolerans TaxID=264641 RepID=UPI0004834A0B|nr:NrfD/PsrC family molybdoenzyme membrane anchor subunit [Desulfitibacter alkalitolerans]
MVGKKYSQSLIIGLVLLFVVLAVSMYLGSAVFLKGHTVFGTTDQVGWNILIAAYIFLALTASGLCLTANFFEVLEIHRFQLLQKRAHFLAISILIPALGMLAMDIGRIDRIFYFITSPNFASPMWWMGAVYAVYLVLLIFEFWAIHHNYKRIVKAASIITLIAAVSATSILGGIFGVILDKPLWFGSGTPVFFVFSAVISGIAAMILGTIMTYKVKKKVIEEDLQRAIKELSTILTVLLAVALLFTIWRLITVYFANVPDTSYVIGSPYGMQFWLLYVGVGILIPFILLLNPSTRNESYFAAAGLMVLIGMYVDKHILIISGQLNQPFGIPVEYYTSTLHEWAIIFGALAVSILIYIYGSLNLSLGSSGSPESKANNKIAASIHKESQQV